MSDRAQQDRVERFQLLDGTLDDETMAVLREAKASGIPFFVNPYYLSLLNVDAPDELDWDEMATRWARELERWGGQEEFARHWNACRELEHEFVHCDVLQHPWKLVQRVRTERRAAIWWSNAFFTMCGNWFHDVEERRTMYERWAERLAATSPELLLYGSDYNNVNVNGISAGEYWVRYRNGARSALEPSKLARREIRM